MLLNRYDWAAAETAIDVSSWRATRSQEARTGIQRQVRRYRADLVIGTALSAWRDVAFDFTAIQVIAQRVKVGVRVKTINRQILTRG